MKNICVTLVNTNEKEEILKALSTLFENSKNSGLDIGVVVVDNNSSDNVEELIEMFPRVVVVKQEKNQGFGASHNRAFEAMEAEYYFVLNPDTEFFGEISVLKKMYDYMQAHSKIGILGPKIVYPDGSLQYSCFRFPLFVQPFFRRTLFGQIGRGKELNDKFLMKDFDHLTERPVDWLMGSALFVRAAALKDVGGFDKRFWMYAEDSDLCRRFWEKNWGVYYYPKAALQHTLGRASSRVPGIIYPLIKNKYARAHLLSWFKYFWKWRGNHKYYR